MIFIELVEVIGGAVMAVAKRQISITLDVDLIDMLDEMSDNVGMNRSMLINTLLRTGTMNDYKGLFNELAKVAEKKKEAKKESELVGAV